MAISSCIEYDSWAEGEEHPVTHARTLQLDIRTREVYEAYHSFKRLLSHVGDLSIKIEGLEGDGRQSWIDSLKDKVDVDDLRLTGHSFGGGTIVCLFSIIIWKPNTKPLP